MFIFYLTIIHINYFGMLIHCISGTSKFGTDNYSQSTGIFCSSNNCQQHTAVIAGSIVGGGIAMILILIAILFCCCRCRGRPSQTNSKFVNTKNNTHHIYNNTLFKSGLWSCRYLQNGIWYGPNYISLSFNSRTLTITGSGTDNIGIFIIDGTYSIQTGRIGLIKKYQYPNGNRSEYLEYQIIIQLIWNTETHQFEGKKYVQTKTYREENRFELKFSKQQQQQSSLNNKI